ncbi:MAG: hypothetical protein CMH50_01195, partial [Myxococcales bacterium]|nr:hypothetical protein [Myxococcales bacterium]
HYEKGGRNDRAMETRRQFVADFPKSELVGRVDFLLANAGVKTADYENAATRLERFARANPKDDRARSAWLDASVYREGLGQYKKALEDRRRWIKLAKASKEVEPKRLRAVQISLGKIIDKVEKPGRAAGYYDRLAGSFKDPTAQLQARGAAARSWRQIRSSRAWAKQGKKRSERRLAEAVARYKEQGLELSGEAANVVAEAELAALEPAYLEFAKQRLPSPDRLERFQQAREAIENRLAELSASYEKIVGIGSRTFTVDALERMGGLRNRYIKILMSVPAPRGLSEVQRELWQDKLTEWTMPIETQALTYYEKCAELARKAALERPAVDRCMDVLKAKKPQDYPRLVEELPPRSGLRLSRHSGFGVLDLKPGDLSYLAQLIESGRAVAPSEVPTPEEVDAAAPAESSKADQLSKAEEEARRTMQDDGTVETDEGAASSDFFEEEE